MILECRQGMPLSYHVRTHNADAVLLAIDSMCNNEKDDPGDDSSFQNVGPKNNKIQNKGSTTFTRKLITRTDGTAEDSDSLGAENMSSTHN